jgi:hypothetical protein
MANKSNSTVADVEIANDGAEGGNATPHDGGFSLEQLDKILDAFAPLLKVRSFVPTMGVA